MSKLIKKGNTIIKNSKEVTSYLKIIRVLIKMSNKGGERLYDSLCQSCLLPIIETVVKEKIIEEDTSIKEDGPYRCC